MDFDPDHAKWQCCCCHLASGLKILATSEIFAAVICVVYGVVTLSHEIAAPEENDTDIAFAICLIVTMLITIVGSGYLIYGIAKNRVQYMYPTLTARVVFIIFVTVFGVKEVVVDPQEEAEEGAERGFIRMINGKPVRSEDEPPVVMRLVFLVFVMIFVSIGIMYTIYLVVRCIRFVKASATLERRRESLIIAGQIDPEYLRHYSHASQL